MAAVRSGAEPGTASEEAEDPRYNSDRVVPGVLAELPLAQVGHVARPQTLPCPIIQNTETPAENDQLS